MVRVRFAPSPTGIPHIGNTRTALYNFLFARHGGGKFIVRIEDTDQDRLVPGSLEKILEILKFVGITWDEGPGVGGPYEPYQQSERLQLYRQYAEQLVKQGWAYYDEQAIRFKIPKDRKVSWEDLIQGKIEIASEQMDDPVLLKTDGFPTYHLAVVVDDHLMEITHILRGAEWISSTPKHLLLYEALGWQPPAIGHFSVILGPDKAKLSKRHGAKSILEYRDEGYLPRALTTFMAYLGWSYQDNSQLLSLEELAEKFDTAAVHKQNPIFDQKKLDYFNAKLIRELDDDQLLADLRPFIPADCSESMARKILPLLKDRLIKLAEWEPLTAFFYREVSVDPEIVLKNGSKELVKAQLKTVMDLLEAASSWEAEKLETEVRSTAEKQGWQRSQFFMMLRVVVTGRTVTPPLFATMEVLGKDITIKRLAHAKDAILQ